MIIQNIVEVVVGTTVRSDDGRNLDLVWKKFPVSFFVSFWECLGISMLDT